MDIPVLFVMEFHHDNFCCDDESIPFPFPTRVFSLRPFAAVTTQIGGGFASSPRSNDARNRGLCVVARAGQRKWGCDLRRFDRRTAEKMRNFASDGRFDTSPLIPLRVELFFPTTLTSPADILSRSRGRGIPTGAERENFTPDGRGGARWPTLRPAGGI